MTEVRFTLPFQRRLKPLAKRYRQIQIDIQSIIDQLEASHKLKARFVISLMWMEKKPMFINYHSWKFLPL